jgi:ABC-type branched-subunit amino acid transport system ATPase component/ABC-type branched-subunit amino acid transport system permease subunit
MTPIHSHIPQYEVRSAKKGSMNEVIRFALLGLGVGALYAFASQGLIVIYRGTGVLNFSLGATAIAGVFMQWELQYKHGWPFLAASLVGVALSAFLGFLTHWVIMRPLRKASSLVRVIATLGVLVFFQAGVIIRYGSNPRQVPSWLPTKRVTLWGNAITGVGTTADRFILLSIACASAFGLWLLYRASQFGLATEAVSESERSASAVGISPNKIAVLNWALGSALAAVAGILVVPIITLQVTVMTSLVLAGLAAALIADFRSFPIATAAGIGLGMAEKLVGRFFDKQQGLGSSLPFLVVIVFLVFRGRSLPLRDYFLRQLPMVGNGRLSWDWMLFGFGCVVFLMLTKQNKWVDALTVTMGVSIVLLSMVVLTGYAGQLSLCQYAIAGFGAYVAGRLVAVFHIPFLLGLVAGVLAAIPLGIVFGLPAVRTRGINLAIVTLGLGTTMELMLFRNRNYTGGVKGTQVSNPHLFGYDISSTKHPTRYGIFVVALAMLTVWLVSNVRRGRSGRRLLAVRTNERAAASLGIDVTAAKLFAFAFAAAIAALGGILLAFRSTSMSYQSFTSFTSVTYVGLVLVGGVGHLLGAFVGGTMATAALNQEILNSTWEGVGRWIQLISGAAILLTVLSYQDGVAAEWVKIFRLFKKARKWGRPYTIDLADVADTNAAEDRSKVTPRTLSIEGLTVRYGTVVAVDKVTYRLEPGTVTGLIGPNGAGKTSLIDAISGFAPAEGRVIVDALDLSKHSPMKRARAGVARSFQSLELFEDATVFENLSVAADPQDLKSYVRDLVHPVNPPFSAPVVRAIVEFQLDQDLHRDVKDLSYGKRRLLSIARAVAMHPSVLLLDEPAAGLSSAESMELAAVVRRLAEDWGMTVLVVEHDMNFVMGVCDQVMVLDFGKLIASGSPEVVRSNPAVIAAYLGDESDADADSDGSATPATPTLANAASVGGGA